MFPSEESTRRELDAAHVGAECSIDQSEAVIREVQHAQAVLLERMQRAHRRGDSALLEQLAEKHGKLIQLELQLHTAAGELRDRIAQEIARLSSFDSSDDSR